MVTAETISARSQKKQLCNNRNTQDTYGEISIALHWAIALLVLGILAVVVVHIGAAWKHHFILGDGVLARMLPHLEKKD